MGHRRVGGGGHGGGEEAGHGGDRPWVFFMVDCFFLITEFFVLTFKFKVEESVLPQKLPPGGTVPARSPVTNSKETLRVHVSNSSGTPEYEILSKRVSMSELNDMLARSTSVGKEYTVRVSYDANVQFGDVMAVFNACSKMKIAECGLVPLRGAEALGGS